MASTPPVLDETPPNVTAAAAGPPASPAPVARRWRHRPPLVLGVVAAVVAITWVAVSWSAGWWPFRPAGAATSGQAATAPQLVTVSEGSVSSTVSSESTIEAAATDSLSFAASGTVSDVLVGVGDTVTAGQVVARLDSASLRADVADAQARVSDLEAQIANDEDDLAQYREDQADDADDYDDGDRLEDQLESSRAQLEVARDELAEAETALDGATLVATIDGTVTLVDITAGEQLGSAGTSGTSLSGSATGSGASSATLGSGTNTGLPGAGTTSSSTTAQIEIVSTGRYRVELALDSSDVADVAVGQEVTVREATSSSTGGFGGFPGAGAFPGGGFPGGGATAQQPVGGGTEAVDGGASATGTVVEVSDLADASSGVATYAVVVELDDDRGDLYIGTTVVAEIVVAERTNVLLVPSAAVTTEDGRSTVRVALDGTADGRTETRDVTTGASSGNQLEVTSGLEAGEQVVIDVAGLAGRGGAGGFELPEGLDDGELPGGGRFPGGGGFPGGAPGGPAGPSADDS